MRRWIPGCLAGLLVLAGCGARQDAVTEIAPGVLGLRVTGGSLAAATECTAPGCLDNRLAYAARLSVSSCQAARIWAGLRWPFFSSSHSAL